jgi:hypothetical protein
VYLVGDVQVMEALRLRAWDIEDAKRVSITPIAGICTGARFDGIF